MKNTFFMEKQKIHNNFSSTVQRNEKELFAITAIPIPSKHSEAQIG